jgi:UDP-glucose 4-epimerase
MNVLEFRIGDVRSYSDVCSAIKDAQVVVNAAALKQVPTCEYFPEQAVLTNCLGAANIVRAIRENDYPVETVVGVSTDKAVKPVNVMGMTKAIQERIFTAANVLNRKTRFVCVRYGNVLASRGSVIPLFHQQIRAGGPITITHPEMTRFLLSLNQAVDTVFAAIRDAKPGETFIPRVPAATMINVAKALIGGRSIEIEVTGIRPGEKMHEVLIAEEEARRCVRRGSYFSIRPMLPELSETAMGAGDPTSGVTLELLNKEYSSGDDILSFEKTRELLEAHGLLLEQGPVPEEDGELLR